MLDHNSSHLMSDIRSGIADVAIHFAHHTDVFVTVQQRIFLFALATRSVATVAGLVGLETGVGEDDDQSLRIFIGGRNRNVLFGDKLREGWRRQRLGSCHSDDDQLLRKELCWIIRLQH